MALYLGRDKIAGFSTDSRIGDTLPVGAIIDYDGEEVPANWELVEEEEIKNYGVFSSEEQEIGTFMGKPLYRRVIHMGNESGYLRMTESDEFADLYTDKGNGYYEFHFYPTKIETTYYIFHPEYDQSYWTSGPSTYYEESIGDYLTTMPKVQFYKEHPASSVELQWEFINVGNRMIGDVIISVEYTREDWGMYSLDYWSDASL